MGKPQKKSKKKTTKKKFNNKKKSTKKKFNNKKKSTKKKHNNKKKSTKKKGTNKKPQNLVQKWVAHLARVSKKPKGKETDKQKAARLRAVEKALKKLNNVKKAE